MQQAGIQLRWSHFCLGYCHDHEGIVRWKYLALEILENYHEPYASVDYFGNKVASS